MAKQSAEQVEEIDTTSCHARILDDIGSGVFQSGSRLKVQELADRYGTSIIPVREALRMLQGERIVTILPNKGATVALMDSNTLRDIFEILQLLEPYFVASFAQSCTEDDLNALEAEQRLLETIPVEDKAAFAGCDSRMHDIIARKHYNKRAYSIWKVQKRMLNALAFNLPISRARHREIMREHNELLAAFRENDTKRAVDCINRHVQGAGKQMQIQLMARGLV